MMKRMRAHAGDVSEGTRHKIMAKRVILGKKVIFYENGLRVIENEKDINEEEQFNSEILRLAHASLLINDAVGDQKQ
ncbi:MAG: hypothetical protein R3321_09625, partial [Nitrososphaeraceae archaeon]|nr:hypothetical protein [Nitrososphaeraceae archaeon]